MSNLQRRKGGSAANLRVDTYQTKREMMNDECVICYGETDNRVRPCDHVICVPCAKRWMQLKPTCPVCRGNVIDVGDDICGDDITIPAEDGRRFGVTVRNLENGQGVRVTRVSRIDHLHRSGIRRGTIITHINGIPVNAHGDAIVILESIPEREPVYIRTRANRRSISDMFRRFLRHEDRPEGLLEQIMRRRVRHHM